MTRVLLPPRLSVRMLPHYGDHGILVPVEAAHVRRLRDVGFTVSAISVLLAAHGTETYRQALAVQRESLGDELRAAVERLALINQLLDEEGSTMSAITVTRETIPTRTVVALRGTVPAYDEEGRLWAELMPEIARQGIMPSAPCGVFEHDPEYRESDPTLSGHLHAHQRGTRPHRRARPLRGADPRSSGRRRRPGRRPRLQPVPRRPLAGHARGVRDRGVRPSRL
ncbi:hypothetical protein [Janibacter sp. LM]|uniref:MerR family transcriptional regulator n=1 Tax=Janibacter sp. LM TaxID=3144845 RepID=UPI0031F6BC85